jgi:hypothetical protein
MRFRLLAVAGLVGVAGTFGVQATSQAAAWSAGDARAHSAAAVRVPACRLGQLRLGNGGKVSEKTEQETRILVLRNASAQRCGLDGYPVVALLAAHGRVLPFRFRDHGDQMLTSASPHLVVLAAGGRAYFGINKNACVTGSAATARTLTAWPLGQLTVRLARSLDYCGRRDPGHVVDISPFENTVRAVLAS